MKSQSSVPWIAGMCLALGLFAPLAFSAPPSPMAGAFTPTLAKFSADGPAAQDQSLLNGQPERFSTEQSESPYLIIEGSSSTVDNIPLISSKADVDILGTIADVTVTQVYGNEGTETIEAIYVFPGSTRAAVYGLTMTIGDRVIEADIQEKEQARQTYEQAKSAGRTASLLEQHRPNVFQMNIANILPGDTVEVELHYTELLVPTDGIYEFVYPTVVGPRFGGVGGPIESESTDDFTQNPYLAEGAENPTKFALEVFLETGIPLAGIACGSHQIDLNYDAKNQAEVVMAEEDGGNRDFILRYRLEGDQIETGLLTYEGEDENFFVLMAQPPKRVAAEHIPPREYIFVVDVSGSMNGFPLSVSKDLMNSLLSDLRPQDSFNVLLFASGSTVMSPESVVASPKNIRQAINIIDNYQGSGGTQLATAMERAMKLPTDGETSRSIVVVTDGYISFEAQTFDLVRENLNRANLFAFGIGSSVNRHLIEGLAAVGQGEPFVITSSAEAKKTASKFRKYIESPVLTQIDLRLEGFDAYDLEPALLPDLFAERPIMVVGKFKGEAKGRIHLSGYDGQGAVDYHLDVQSSSRNADNRALEQLWARERLRTLSDYHQLQSTTKLKEEITDLGLNYNLLTPFTSFVAVDSEVRGNGVNTTVKQPLDLAQGLNFDGVVGISGGGYGRSSSSSAGMLAATASAPRRSRSVAKFKKASTASAPRESLTMAPSAGLVDETSEAEGAIRSLEEQNKEAKDKGKALETATITVLSGNGDIEALNRILSAHHSSLESCVLAMKGTQSGPLSITLSFLDNGELDGVEVLSQGKALTDQQLESCLKTALKALGKDMKKALSKTPTTLGFELKF